MAKNMMGHAIRCGVILACLFGVASASEVNIAQTDFSERVINFVIFLAILWYLGAHRLKALLQARRDGISKRFDEVQNKISAAKKAKEQAQKQLGEAQKRAADIIATAKKEAIVIAQKYEEQCSADIESMIKSNESLMFFEQRKAKVELVESVLKELFNSEVADINAEEYVRILSKKVA